MHEYNRGQKTFSVYRATGEDPGACEYHERAQCFAPWFIEGETRRGCLSSRYLSVALFFIAIYLLLCFAPWSFATGLFSSTNPGNLCIRGRLLEYKYPIGGHGREKGRAIVFVWWAGPFLYRLFLSFANNHRAGRSARLPDPAALDIL